MKMFQMVIAGAMVRFFACFLSVLLVAVLGMMVRKKMKKCERQSTKLTTHLF